MSIFKFARGFGQAAAPVSVPAPAAPPAPSRPDFQQALGRDAVTGLPNRACFTYLLGRQCEMAGLLETRLCVLSVRWDGWARKAASLDQAARATSLANAAARLRGGMNRTYDVIGTLADGHFAVMLPFTDGAGANAVARNLQHLFSPAAAPGAAPDAPPGQLCLAVDQAEAARVEGGLSIGVAAYGGKGKACELTLLQAAEEASEMAQLDGGDKIIRRDTPRARHMPVA